MKKYTGHPRFKELIEEELKLHNAKNKDYARGGDPLGNFHRVSLMLNLYGADEMTPAQVAFIYMMKQVDAAGRMLFQGYEGETEGLKGRLQDVSIYCKLTTILKEEEFKI